jgi:hypothetical protein
MDRFLLITGVACIVIVAAFGGLVATAEPVAESELYGIEDALSAGNTFIIGDETFAFDGMIDTLAITHTGTLASPYTFEITATFTCAHGGYGDRTGMMVTQALTPHTAVLTISKNKVTSAVIDGQWDMLMEKMA